MKREKSLFSSLQVALQFEYQTEDFSLLFSFICDSSVPFAFQYVRKSDEGAVYGGYSDKLI